MRTTAQNATLRYMLTFFAAVTAATTLDYRSHVAAKSLAEYKNQTERSYAPLFPLFCSVCMGVAPSRGQAKKRDGQELRTNPPFPPAMRCAVRQSKKLSANNESMILI